MSDLSVVGRERVALAAIADAVVAASVGRGLRVAVTCPAARLALVGHLAQALHARGRTCRCLPAEPDPSQPEGGPVLVVIVSGFDTETDRAVQRVNVRVTPAGVPTARRAEAHPGNTDKPSAAGGEPDIILDYGDPDGPLIRYMAPHLAIGGQP
ncbi:hypothetical protein [Micromonospora sp. NPDC003776]